MARITVEDCTQNIENRFDLVVVASQRARQILSGVAPTLEVDNDKVPVIALREIASDSINIADIKDAAVLKYRRNIPCDDTLENLEDDEIEYRLTSEYVQQDASSDETIEDETNTEEEPEEE